MKSLDLEDLCPRDRQNLGKSCPLIWHAIAKLLSILQVRARFLEGRECEDESERVIRHRGVIARRGSPTCRTVIRIKCRRERDFRLFVKMYVAAMMSTMNRRRRIFVATIALSCFSLANAFVKPDDNPDIELTTVSGFFHGFPCSNNCCNITNRWTKRAATTDGILNVSFNRLAQLSSSFIATFILVFRYIS